MKNIFIPFAKRAFLSLVMVFSIVAMAYSQVPSFYNLNGGAATSGNPLNSNTTNKVQWIYPAGAFNSNGSLGGTPAYLGLIDTVYFRVGNSSGPTYTDLTVRLGQNVGTQSSFTSAIFNLGMTQVYYDATIQRNSSANTWFYIVLQTPFLYDPSLSLVVEVEHNAVVGGGINIREDNGGGNAKIQGSYGNTIGSNFGPGRADFGFDLQPAPPCNTQTLVVDTVKPYNPIICSGQSLNLNAPNATLGSGYTYQWQSAPGIAGPWTNIAGANNLNYQTPILTTTTSYRLYMVCNANMSSDTSIPTTISVSLPTYAPLPYTQGFENWVSYCGNQDVPNDYHWLNTPTTGNNSWRREDQGPTASWGAPNGGLYFPSSTEGNHSARFHSYLTTNAGSLDLYVDCSGAGVKTLSFDYINDGSPGGNDQLTVEYRYPSLLPTTLWLPATTLSNTGNAWTNQTAQINSTDPQTRIRFRATGGSNFLPGSDIGIDNILILPPCSGPPVAGTIDSTTACPGKDLNLSLSGTTLAGNLTFRWDTASSVNGPWGPVGTSLGPNFTLNNGINSSKYFRCRVICGAPNGPADTTAPIFIDVLPFYICYCDKQANTLFFENVGNVNVRDKYGSPPIINNGIATPTLNNPTSVNPYSLFYNTPGYNAPYPIIFTDSSYYIDVTGITFDNTFSDCFAKVFIDYNRDGVYNFASELALQGYVRSTNNYMAVDSFTVPTVTNFGLTGMRVVLQQGAVPNSVLPCGPIGRGEVEDYVIDLQRLPCNSSPNPGTSQIDDTTVCPNGQVRIINNNHDKAFASLNFSWQESTNGVAFTDIPGGAVDTMFRIVNQDMWYRYRINCRNGADVYSNVVKARLLPPANCNSVSAAIGPGDKSDIGAMVISTPPPANINLYTFSSGGPHLNNPASYKYYTNRTTAGNLGIYVDSIYKFSVYHILNTPAHTDAQVTIFIDYNNNQMFDLPTERVYSGVTSASNFFLTGLVGVPPNAVTNVPTLMRVVLNDDLSPNSASTTGSGTYVSGETEDYYIVFKDKPVSTKDISSIASIGIYPNPTNGIVNVDFDAVKSTNLSVEVVNLLGSVLKTKDFGKVNGQQHKTIDLTGLSKGIYLMRFTTDDSKFVRKITVK